MSQYRVTNKDRSASTVFLNFREEKGDTEAATLAFAKTLEKFNVTESETRNLVKEYPGIIELLIKGLTSVSV